MLTAGVQAQSPDTVAAVLAQVRGFTAFDDGNDPHGEHDFGEVEVADARFVWKLDYFDNSLRLHSPDAADPVVTARVLTVMTAGES